MINSTKGITLVALVVTIIILLILAGVTSNLAFGENGIINKGKQAVNEYKKVSENEITLINATGKWLEEQMKTQNDDHIVAPIEDSEIIGDGSYSDIKGVNTPKLASGMIPVAWDSSDNEYTPETENEWYNYEENKWANAITKDNNGNITGYWVWIPRYAYKITNGYHSMATTTGSIDIKFLKGTTTQTQDQTIIETSGYVSGTKDTRNNYFLHPVFSSNVDLGGWDSELTGIWIAKFEASAFSSLGVHVNTSSEGIGNVTTLNVRVLPNVSSWRYIYTGNSYKNCLNMLPGANSHMIKNSEWGAVAYLSVSKYGKGSGNEVKINNSETYLTGNGDYANNKEQSTTGNIYGIYDMNGGAWERTASYLSNMNSILMTYGSSFASIDQNPVSNRYVTVYKMGVSDTQQLNYNANINMYGDSIYEISGSYSSSNGSWFGDYAYFPYSSTPFFLRSGGYAGASSSGVFAFYNTNRYVIF